jgi:DNA-binding MarR family transcriptional regulator
MMRAGLRLDDQLCFALYAATNAITRAYRPLLRELGITYPQYLTLMALWQHGTGTVSGLAQLLDLPAHAMTPLLQRLEHAGLIVRRRSPIDSRVVLVELTPNGVELETKAATVQRTVECATGLSPQALAALRGELHDLVNDLRANAAGPTPMEGKAS